MKTSEWRKKLGQVTRALARLLGGGGDPRYRERVEGGDPPGQAALAVAREQLRNEGGTDTLRLGYDLLRHPETVEAGRVVLGLSHLANATPVQAWAEFVQLKDPELQGSACPEYAVAGFGAEPDACAGRLERVLDDAASSLTGYAALMVARHAFSVGHEPLARRIADAADQGTFGELSEYFAGEFERLRSWFTDGFRRRPQHLVPADLRFGVLDYKQPHNSSRNVGDFIQTLASLGHLVRQERLTLTGEPALVDAVNGLRAKVKPERLRTDASATVQLLEVQRDGNVYQDLPEPTWAVMFGWYLHPTYSGGYNLPFHPNLRPLFVSFHLNKPDALTPAAAAYLRRYGPIGCRDWQTVALLGAAGVPAFFSGCITTTVDTVFARTGPDERTGIAYVDAREAPEEDEQIEQSVGDIRPQPLTANLALGREWVERYASEFAEVSTTRLHSYLPARSVGCTVDFHPRNPSDVRFGGLIAIDDEAYERIRQGILDKLASMLGAIAEGAEADAVHARWRELCAPDVTAAEAYLDGFEFGSLPLPDLDLSDLTGQVVVISAPTAGKRLRRLLKSLQPSAPGIPVIVVSSAGSDELPTGVRLVSAAEGQDVTVAAVLGALPEGSRALLLTSDTVLRADPSALFDAPVSGSGLAAAPEVRRGRQSLSVLIRRISSAQGDDWRAALRFAAAAHRRCPHGALVPDTRACVVDPAALRAAGWTALAGELIVSYGARLDHALAVVVAGDFTPLPSGTLSRVGVEPVDPDTIVVQGASSARVPAGWLASSR